MSKKLESKLSGKETFFKLLWEAAMKEVLAKLW